MAPLPANGACCKGPGYASPQEAYTKGERERLIYVPCVRPDPSAGPDYLATVDVDPQSATYSKVIHRLKMPYSGDELHHSGWNSCSSCHEDPTRARKYLILPALGSGRIYAVDVQENPREPRLHKTVEGSEIKKKTGLSYPHSSHCLASGELMVSAMGDNEGKGKGNFILLDENFEVTGKWSDEDVSFGYDFWYQPRHNIMISSEFGTPTEFMKGFNPAVVPEHYGSKLYAWDWKKKSLKQTIELGADGLIPLETRFAHNPDSTYGFVGAALSSNVIKFEVDPTTGHVTHKVVIRQPWLPVEGWALPEMPGLITDILISLDDRYLYFSNWLRGDVAQYDITDPDNPKLAGHAYVGGSILAQSGVKAKGDLPYGNQAQPETPIVQNTPLRGGPQMLQLSLDGKRLYVTNSLLSSWDKQFYPNMARGGSHMIVLDVNTESGGLSVNKDFLVDFGKEPEGPVLAHECRYPGGDCSSDIWI